MVNSKLLSIFLAAALLGVSCKNDDEDDIIPDASEIKGLCINEVYSSNPDWIELYNSSDVEMDLSGFVLQDDKGATEEYKIPSGTKISAKSYLVLDGGKDFSFGISSSKGDEVVLLDNKNAEVDRISVPVLEDGNSYGRTADGGAEWKTFDKSTKGKSNSAEGDTTEDPQESRLKLFVNEIMSAPAGDDVDFIELYNDEDRDVDISGFILQDDKGEAEQFVVPSGTVIPSKGFLVYEQVSPGEGDSFTFGLSSKGDKVVFLEADGKLIDKVETPSFGSDKGSAYARIGDGGAQWQVVSQPTKGASNVAEATIPLLGNLVINEVYTFSDQSSVDDLDYIELYNKSNQTLDLSGLRLWESGGREEAWTFPQGKTIAPQGLLVIECDKEGFHNDAANFPAWGLSKGPDEYIVIATADMIVIDSVACPSLKQHESYGRRSNGAGEWQIFAQYTRNADNEGAARQLVSNSIGLFINEVFANNQDAKTQDWDDTRDFVELYNDSDKTIDLSGFSMNDDALNPDKKYTFPAGTSIPAKGFLTFEVFKKNLNGPVFGLGKGGDWVFLYDKKGVLISEMEAPAFEDHEIYSVGRKIDGADEIVVFTEVSKNGSNNNKAVKR